MARALLVFCMLTGAASGFAPRRTPATAVNAARAATATAEKAETFEFSAETDRVMEIIINSLYSDKDVFLRELVSNAADACDKKRFLSLSEGGASADALRVRITADKEAKTLVIEDTGVGMTRDELVNNLGKIARSGTKAFSEALGDGASSDDVNLIGQFGVGFYSGYLVADSMSVVTKALNGDGAHKWTSDAKAGFTVEKTDETIDAASGTRITLSLKEDCAEYLEEATLRRLLKRYSEFLQFPIELLAEKTEYESVVDEEATAKSNETDPVMKSVPKTTTDYEVVNAMRPLWLRSPKDVNASEHAEFYKSAFRAFDDPLKTVHFALEGQVQFKALLYVPSRLPFELSQNMFDENANAMKLYVKRVFINDKFDLVPRWLVFLRGIVDSEDLPLNVGREILQKSKMLNVIQKRLVRKAIDAFADIQKNATAYDTFWQNFGKYIKVGAVEETGDVQKDLAKLCQFYSTTTDGDATTTLAAYASRMPENATKILYLSGESKQGAAMSPVLERLKKMDYEVLLLPEPLDELVVSSLGEFDGKRLVDAAKDDLADIFGDDTDDDADAGDFEPLCESLKEFLGSDKVAGVKLSKRLTESPAALVEGAYGMSPVMRRYMAAQATTNDDFSRFGGSQPTMEINPDSAVVKSLKDADFAADETKDAAALLFDVAALTGGYDIAEPSDFARRVNALMAGAALPQKPAGTADSPEVIVDDE
jgi:heat shock protein beta